MDSETVDRTFTPAAHEALKAFPIDAEDLTLVSLSENVTFKVADRRDGRAYVLRLHRPGYHTLQELISERAWIRALAEAGIDVPSAVLARDGQDYVPVTIPATGEQRFAGMASWTEGRLLSDVLAETDNQKRVEESFTQLGAITAAMHNQASAWQPPPGFKRHALDSDGLMGMAPHWGEFWEHRSLSAGERRLLLEMRQRLHDMLGRLSREPHAYSLIHADMHPGNIVVDGDRLTVIDFDDAGYGWHQYDLATALTHWQTKSNAAEIERAFLAGYRAGRPVADEALSLLPQFRLIRWMATIGWFHQRPEVNRPSSVFEERKAWVLEQCEALQRSRL
ncbi:phosphotransferase [Reyranella sp. MMS21-HV4-11]|uniref:Phosphotransferase n=1 Tax=Reyranella humidisoli TaxID=2849149 RepID=A0ABS6IGV2_9HYPH|nr:phosphotransferase [Reyranella sp. MMS21-HV4-11]MBU8873215.1 phosphotransferase [Reyranella sp. MMS21-HV4-11]